MNKIIKKAAAVILAAAMILTSIPFMGIDISESVRAEALLVTDDENQKISGDFIYVDGNTSYSEAAGITLVKYVGNDKSIVVPEIIDGKPVTCIKRYFLSNTNVTSITLPSTVKMIDYLAFEDSALESMTFNNNSDILYCENTSINYYDFLNKKHSGDPQYIKTVSFCYLPDSFTGTFYGDDYEISYDESGMWVCEYNGEEASGSNTEERIWNDYNYYVTEDNKAVVTKYLGTDTDVTVPEHIGTEKFSVVRIGQRAFEKTGITNVVIPDSVTEIGNYAFYRCYELKNAVLPDRLTQIGTHVFGECRALEEINWPSAMKYVPAEAFAYCYSLVDFSTFTGTEIICSAAFYDCKNLVIDDFGNNIREIGPLAFDSESVYNGIRTTVMDSDFSENLEHIGSYAFESCDFPDEVVIPEKVSLIGNGAFAESSVKKVRIRASLKEISLDLFSCSDLTDIEIPESIEKIGGWAFSGCTDLKTIDFNAVNCEFSSLAKTDIDGIYYSPFAGCTSLEKINIGEKVKELPGFLFAGIESIGEIELPPTVTDVGSGAFAFSSITSFKGTDNLESIEEYAFYGCENLKNVDLSSNIMLIGEAAFMGSGVKEIYNS